MSVRLLVVLCLCLVPSLADAATYYVAKTGGDDSRNCATATNVATPKLTITSGMGCLTAAGDTLFVRTGTYNERVLYTNLPTSGTQASPITIKNYNGEVVTVAPVALGCYAILMGNKSWITIDGINADGIGITNCGLSGGGSAVKSESVNGVGLTFKNLDIKDAPGSNLFEGDQLLIENVTVHGTGWRARLLGYGPGSNGIYASRITNSIFRRVESYDNACFGIRIFNSATTPKANNNIVEYSSSHHNGVGVGLSGTSDLCSSDGGFVIADTNNTVRFSLSYGNHGTGIRVFAKSGTDANKFFSNTIYNNTNGIVIESGPTNTQVRNTISVGNGANQLTGSATTSGNKTTGTITDCTVSTSDLTQKAGSSCIDAGTTATALSYNGANPDQGAFEMPAFASCVVENGDASTIRVTFENNQNPPLLPSTGITGFTARKAGANDVITAAVRTGDNRVDLTLTDAIVNGNAVDISYSGSGNLTDSALIGNTTNQGYKTVLTNQSCTNNVGAAASHVFTQAAFEFHGLRGTEAAPVGTPYATAPENTNIFVRVGGSVRLRIAVTCTTTDCPPTGFFPRYSKNAGGYSNVVPDVFAADNIGFCGTGPDPDIPTSGTATTDQLSTSGTFVAGALVRTSNAIPTVDIGLNGKTELEYCFSFDTDATAGDTYDIRIYQQDGTALNAYTVTPRMTLAAPSAGFGF